MLAAMLGAMLAGCDPAPEDIAKAIGSENPVMREDGAKIAQNYDDEVVIQALLAVVNDPAPQVRLNAIESLAELEALAASPALIAILSDDPNPKVRRAAADALGRLKAKDAVPALITYVTAFKADDHEQLAGLWALGNIGGEGLDPALKQQALLTLAQRREGTADRFIRYTSSAALRTLK